jgi:hypothetical protein
MFQSLILSNILLDYTISRVKVLYDPRLKNGKVELKQLVNKLVIKNCKASSKSEWKLRHAVSNFCHKNEHTRNCSVLLTIAWVV